MIDSLDKLTPTLNLVGQNYNIGYYNRFKVKVLFYPFYISFIFKKENKTIVPCIVSYNRDFQI